jgi:predicted Na+-dependent transporter
VLAPFALLAPLAWAVSREFADPVREGLLALGVSCTEVAAVGLVALAGGGAVLALGALTGSLIVSALAGPPLLSLLAGGTDVAVAELVSAALANVLFLLLSAVPVAAWILFAPRDLRVTGAFVIGLRDFAVAAALAAQAFGPPAATVAGVYGVLMLLVGAAAAQLLPTPAKQRADSPVMR